MAAGEFSGLLAALLSQDNAIRSKAEVKKNDLTLLLFKMTHLILFSWECFGLF